MGGGFSLADFKIPRKGSFEDDLNNTSTQRFAIYICLKIVPKLSGKCLPRRSTFWYMTKIPSQFIYPKRLYILSYPNSHPSRSQNSISTSIYLPTPLLETSISRTPLSPAPLAHCLRSTPNLSSPQTPHSLSSGLAHTPLLP